jgi:uncharacterized Zn-binding protein involved in type VI secretion
MAKVCRVNLDYHIGHASGTPNPFHRTPYYTGSPNTFINGEKVVRQYDVTACGDMTVGCSSTVFVNGFGVHRVGDATAGHGSWVPNAGSTGAPTVDAGG